MDNMPSPPSSALRTKLETGGVAISVSLTLSRVADVPMMAAAAGYDALFVDMEHGPVSLETASLLCTASIGFGITPLVRLPSLDKQLIAQVFDAGAMGIIVPDVRTPAEAEFVVTCCRCPPRGHRTIYGASPATGYKSKPLPELSAYLDRETFVCVMIESQDAVANADEIAAVQGLDMVLVGPHDLTADMGIQGQFHDPRFLSAVEKVAEACRSRNVFLGVAGIRDQELLRKFITLGVRFINAGGDAGMLMAAMRAEASKIRELDTDAV